MKRIAVIPVIGFMAALAACGGGSPKVSNSLTPTPSASLTRLTSTGHLIIVSPTPNEVIHGSTLHVKVTLTGARIVSQTTQNVTPDTGHIHVSIDGIVKTFYSGVEYDATGLTPGLHVVTVEFVMANHVPFNPRVLMKQAFRVV
ncbi:MAG TPA: hypothetical protein VKV69_01825 [Actinomycetota bacterium]|nr:hypothetical protein [Actinomycetota bacterium]